MITRILLKQPLNFWRGTSWGYRLQLLALLTVVGAYLVSRLIDLFVSWMSSGPATPAGLSTIIVFIFLMLSAITAPFILLNILPQRGAIKYFLDKPLSKTDTLWLLLIFTLKYQIVLLTAVIPAVLALIIVTPEWGVITFFLILILFMIIPTLNIVFFHFSGEPKRYLCFHFLGVILFALCFAGSYWYVNAPWLFLGIGITGLIAIFLFLYHKQELDLAMIYHSGRNTNRSSGWKKTRLSQIPRFLPRKVHILFSRELRSQWRNPRFVRHKFNILLNQVALSLLIIIQYQDSETAISYLLFLTIALIWWHYGSYFSEKYTDRDLNWLINTMPIRFLSIFIAKFFAELAYVLIILGVQLVMTLLISRDLNLIIQMMLIPLIFAVVMVSIMINFQIMFYDNPRTAGYAFHFGVVFFVIMSINYRLVGPFMTLFMIGYLFYKNIRFFRT